MNLNLIGLVHVSGRIGEGSEMNSRPSKSARPSALTVAEERRHEVETSTFVAVA